MVIVARQLGALKEEVDVTTRRKYDELGARLRRAGFQPDVSEDAPLCRWRLGDIIVDVMPTVAAVLGFTSSWYRDTVAHAMNHELEPGLVIRVATAPHFIAMKLEAFDSRGDGGYMASHDLEDVVAIVDGRAELVNEVAAVTGPLRSYLRDRVAALLDDPEFVAALPGHLAGDYASQSRLPLVLGRLRAISGLSDASPSSQ